MNLNMVRTAYSKGVDSQAARDAMYVPVAAVFIEPANDLLDLTTPAPAALDRTPKQISLVSY